VLDPYSHGREVSISSLAAITGATFTWMLAQSIFGLTRTLYHRADLDLLLGAPLPAGRVIAVKVVSIAASTFGSIAILALPVANSGAWRDAAHWLGIYPLLIAFALMATAFGLALVAGLFMLVGPRRARLLAHLLAAGVAGLFVLGTQIIAMLPVDVRGTLTDWVDAAIHEQTAGLAAVLWVPVATVQGDPVSASLLMALAVLALGWAVASFAERFAAARLAAAGSGSEPSAAESSRLKAYRGGLATALRLKEWRLLRRDPSFFAQLALQIVYTIPVAVVLVRSEMLTIALSLGPTIVMIAAQVSGSIAWITVSGEDAPELIASAPVGRGAVERAKLGAVALPVLALLALPMAGLSLVASPEQALVVLATAAMAATSTALLNFWHPMPGNRRGMLRRHSQSKLIGMVEHGLAMLWAFAVVFALMGAEVVIVPLVMIVGALVVMRRLGRQAGNADRTVAPSNEVSAGQPGRSRSARNLWITFSSR
jgi:ABC-2 type transport system permease protein